MKVKGGDKFTKALEERVAKSKKAKKVDIGFFEDKTYPDGTSVALVAAMNEWGSGGFLNQEKGAKFAAQKGGVAPTERHGRPPRPFFRDMIQKYSKEWPEAVRGVLKRSEGDVELALETIGSAIEGQLRQSIVDYVGPPLAAATIAAKGFDKQLIDTSTMLNSISSKVKT